MQDDLNNLLSNIHKLQQKGDLPQSLNIKTKIIDDFIYINIKMTHNEAKDFGYILCNDPSLNLKNYKKSFSYNEQTEIYELIHELAPADVIPIFVHKEEEE